HSTPPPGTAGRDSHPAHRSRRSAQRRHAAPGRSDYRTAAQLMSDRRRSGGDTSPLPPVRKSLGQHFLNDKRILGRIVDALELTGNETVVEIGPGRGALTELLLPRARRVVAIEYDRQLAQLLRVRY